MREANESAAPFRPPDAATVPERCGATVSAVPMSARTQHQVPRTRQAVALALLEFVDTRESLRNELFRLSAKHPRLQAKLATRVTYLKRQLRAHDALLDAVVQGKAILGILDRLHLEQRYANAVAAAEIVTDWFTKTVEAVHQGLGRCGPVEKKRNAFRAFMADGVEARRFATEFVDVFFDLWAPSEDEVGGLVNVARLRRQGASESVTDTLRRKSWIARRMSTMTVALNEEQVVETLFGGSDKGRGAQRAAELVVASVSGISDGWIRRVSRERPRRK